MPGQHGRTIHADGESLKALNGNTPENAQKFAESIKAKGLIDQEAIDAVMELWNKCAK